MRAKIVLPSCPNSNITLTFWEGHFISRLCARGASRQGKSQCRGLYVHCRFPDEAARNTRAFPCGSNTHNDKYIYIYIYVPGVLVVKATRNIGAFRVQTAQITIHTFMWCWAACLPFGRRASVIGGWCLGEVDAFVLEVQPFYVSWQLLDANLTFIFAGIRFRVFGTS